MLHKGVPISDETVVSSNVLSRRGYVLADKIGVKAGYNVYAAHHVANSDEKLSVKVMRREYSSDEKAFLKEVAVLRRLHKMPNVIQLVDFFIDVDLMYLVNVLPIGGNLFDQIKARETYTEYDVRDFAGSLIRIIDNLHNAGVVHRNLKPENILFRSKDNTTDMCLGDFSFALSLPGNDSHGLFGCTGRTSHEYMAPEMMKFVKHGKPVDMWSVGCILYFLLGGSLPFGGFDSKDMYTRISEGDFNFGNKNWDFVTEDSKDLICNLLKVDHKKRWTADEALNSDWFSSAAEIKLKRTNLIGSLRKIQMDYNDRIAKNVVPDCQSPNQSNNNIASSVRQSNSSSVFRAFSTAKKNFELPKVTTTTPSPLMKKARETINASRVSLRDSSKLLKSFEFCPGSKWSPDKESNRVVRQHTENPVCTPTSESDSTSSITCDTSFASMKSSTLESSPYIQRLNSENGSANQAFASPDKSVGTPPDVKEDTSFNRKNITLTYCNSLSIPHLKEEIKHNKRDASKSLGSDQQGPFGSLNQLNSFKIKDNPCFKKFDDMIRATASREKPIAEKQQEKLVAEKQQEKPIADKQRRPSSASIHQFNSNKIKENLCFQKFDEMVRAMKPEAKKLEDPVTPVAGASQALKKHEGLAQNAAFTTRRCSKQDLIQEANKRILTLKEKINAAAKINLATPQNNKKHGCSTPVNDILKRFSHATREATETNQSFTTLSNQTFFNRKNTISSRKTEKQEHSGPINEVFRKLSSLKDHADPIQGNQMRVNSTLHTSASANTIAPTTNQLPKPWNKERITSNHGAFLKDKQQRPFGSTHTGKMNGLSPSEDCTTVENESVEFVSISFTDTLLLFQELCEKNNDTLGRNNFKTKERPHKRKSPRKLEQRWHKAKRKNEKVDKLNKHISQLESKLNMLKDNNMTNEEHISQLKAKLNMLKRVSPSSLFTTDSFAASPKDFSAPRFVASASPGHFHQHLNQRQHSSNLKGVLSPNRQMLFVNTNDVGGTACLDTAVDSTPDPDIWSVSDGTADLDIWSVSDDLSNVDNRIRRHFFPDDDLSLSPDYET